MLKIKDNVDLKELEKFGFELQYFDYNLNKKLDIPICKKEYKKFKNGNYSYIFIINRKIYVNKSYSYYYVALKNVKKYIQDLIQAGLVEKVVEDE